MQHVERADARDQHGEAERQKIIAPCLGDDGDERDDEGRNGKASGPYCRGIADEQHEDGADHGDRCARGPVGDEARQRSAGDRASQRGEIADLADQRQLRARRDAAEQNRRREDADRNKHRGRRLAHACGAFIRIVEQIADDARVVDDGDDSAEQHQRRNRDMAGDRGGVDHQELRDEAGERRQAHDCKTCERVSAGGEWHDAAEAGEVFQAPPAGPQNKGARGVEEEGLHHRVVGQMQQRRRRSPAPRRCRESRRSRRSGRWSRRRACA